MSARKVIEWTMKSLGAFDPTREADAVLVALQAAGYRILAPGEVDAETLERAAQVAESTPAYGDPVEIGVGLGPAGERIASAIRTLNKESRDE